MGAALQVPYRLPYLGASQGSFLHIPPHCLSQSLRFAVTFFQAFIGHSGMGRSAVLLQPL
jgi:hypothetical protein